MDLSHLFLFFLLGLLLSRLKIEGFSKSGYDYLKPIPSPPPEIDNTLALKFMTLLIKNSNKYLVKPSDESKPIDITNVNKTYTLEEINYYIENNKFPYDTYVTNYLNKNRTIIHDQKSSIFNAPLTLDIMQEIWSSRLVYLFFIQPKEVSLNPKPFSYEIYMGTNHL